MAQSNRGKECKQREREWRVIEAQVERASGECRTPNSEWNFSLLMRFRVTPEPATSSPFLRVMSCHSVTYSYRKHTMAKGKKVIKCTEVKTTLRKWTEQWEKMKDEDGRKGKEEDEEMIRYPRKRTQIQTLHKVNIPHR